VRHKSFSFAGETPGVVGECPILEPLKSYCSVLGFIAGYRTVSQLKISPEQPAGKWVRASFDSGKGRAAPFFLSIEAAFAMLRAQ
jgi:hypothetical protein